MSADPVQETAPKNQEAQVENSQESPSNPGLLQEVMSKKATIKEQAAEIAELKAEKEKGRQKTMEEQGQLKELVAELKLTNGEQAVRIERADKIETQLKVDIINSITSDDKKREELASKDIDTLRFIQNEIGGKPVSNPQESLGAVRQPMSSKPWADMDDAERRNHYTQKANEQAAGKIN